MSFLRFKHAFVGLLGASALSAFVLPPRYSRKFQPEVQTLFAPVAWPVRSTAEKLYQRLRPDVAAEARSKQTIVEENEDLRQQVAKLTHDLVELQKISAGFEGLGELKRRCVSYLVVSNDSGTGDSLAIRGSTLDGLKAGQYAIQPSHVVGVVERAGVGGAQVRLVTDAGFGVYGYFATFGTDVEGRPTFLQLKTDPVLVKGVGGGEMVIAMQVKAALDKAGVKPGTWVLIQDPEWPPELQGFRLGVVQDVKTRRDSPLHADVRVRPPTELRRLGRVMVMTKE